MAPQQIIKKIKVRGYILHTDNCQALQYSRHWAKFGVLFGLCKLSVKIGKTIAKGKTSLDLTLR